MFEKPLAEVVVFLQPTQQCTIKNPLNLRIIPLTMSVTSLCSYYQQPSYTYLSPSSGARYVEYCPSAGVQSSKELTPVSNDPIPSTVPANEFLQVIMMLRKTFIQDSVLMMALHPCHAIWQRSIFSDRAYLSLER
jgi:hypothetical protein